LACHGEGIAVGDRVAARIPHEPYASCLQCHVEAASSSLPPFVLAASSFEGVDAPFEGARAYPGAPPVLPHTTWMRSDCLSCHGPAGDFPMRTSHPERASCLQCHAPSASLDQVRHAALDGPRFWSEADEP
ncbi:MAG: cytochrome c3 family protein, partial [Planctomycetota bacterium JB042]